MPLNRAGLVIATIFGLLFGATLFILTPSQTFILLTGIALAIVILRRPLWGLLIFAFVATLLPYSTVRLGIRTTISEAVLALTWAGVLWQALLGRYRGFLTRFPTERMLVWLMLFSTLPFLAGLWTIAAETAATGVINWIRWLLSLSSLFLVALLLRDERDCERFVVALLLGTLLMLLVSIAMFLQSRNATSMIPLLTKLKYAHPEALLDIFSANYTRMASPWVHPNLTGGALALIIPVALFFGWAQSGWRRTLGLSVALLGCAGLLFSISRGAILALAIVLLWLYRKQLPYSGRVIILGAALTLILTLSYPPLQDRLLSAFSPSNPSTEMRMDEYRLFPEAMKRYPLGIGFKVDPPVPGSGLLGISNLWLNFIYKIGIPGMLLFVAVTVCWWREIRPLGKLPVVTRRNALWLGSLCGVAAALLTGLFDHYFSFTQVLIALFWLLTGLSLHMARLHPDIRNPVPPLSPTPNGEPSHETPH